MLGGIVRTLRPHQWVKNLFVLAPAVFGKSLTDGEALLRASIGFVLFCFVSSAVYVMNDLVDADADSMHPVKKTRPIASGLIDREIAIGIASLLVSMALVGGWLLDSRFFLSLLGYLLLNVGYSFSLKRVPYVDVLCIATGFEFRVLAGTFAAGVPPTGYLLVVTFLLAAFLGFGKRLHELSQAKESHSQRPVLRGYSKQVLSSLLFGTAGLTLGTYATYTLSPDTAAFFGTHQLPWSIPFAVLGVARFLHLVQSRPNAESPTEEMLRDWPFIVNLLLWGAAILVIIYAY